MSVADDQEAFYRSQGWAGTKWDSPRDDDDIHGTGSFARTNYFTDKLKEAAGDDGSLSAEEFVTALNNRPDKYMYNPDTKSNALARFGSSTGFTIDEDIMKQHGLAYEGNDIIQKIDGGYTGPNRAYKDSVTFLRNEEDGDDDSFNYFKWSAVEPDPVTPDPVEPDPVEPDPVVCTPPQVPDPGGSGTCISPPGQETIPDEEDKNKNKGNDWNIGDDIPEKGNPKSTFPGLNFKDFMQGMGVKLGVSQNPMEQMGSIPYITPGNYFNARSDWQNNTTGYKPKSYQKGKFDTFLNSNKPGDATMMADDLIGNLFRA